MLTVVLVILIIVALSGSFGGFRSGMPEFGYGGGGLGLVLVVVLVLALMGRL